jgi:hypothetical protein
VAENDLLGAHGGEEAANAQGEPLLDELVVDPVGIPAFLDQAGCFEQAQVARYGRPADWKTGGYVAGTSLAVPEILEDLSAGGIR